MAESIVQKGIGAELHIQGYKHGFKDMLENLYQTGIAPIDAQSAHVTLIDPEDTFISLHSHRDQMALDAVRDKVGRYLSGLDLISHRLTPKSASLYPFAGRSRKVSVIFSEQDWLEDIRSEIAEIFYQTAHISAAPKEPFVGKMTIGYKPEAAEQIRGDDDAKKRKIELPQSFGLYGFDVTERTSIQRLKSPRKRRSFDGTKFRNLPPSVRKK